MPENAVITLDGKPVGASRFEIPRDGRTRAIDFPGKKRIVRKVALIYKSKGPGITGKAHVLLFGHR